MFGEVESAVNVGESFPAIISGGYDPHVECFGEFRSMYGLEDSCGCSVVDEFSKP